MVVTDIDCIIKAGIFVHLLIGHIFDVFLCKFEKKYVYDAGQIILALDYFY